MVSKHKVERDIRTLSRGCFKQINKHKEYAFIALIFIYFCMVFNDPSFEKTLIFIGSLIGIQMVIIADQRKKIKGKNNKK